jgi:hypothetical protein
MINPGLYNIDCPQGATWDRTFTATIDAAPINLTGYSAAMQVRDAADGATALVSLTSGAGITLGGAAGTIAVTISSTVTAAIVAGSYSYDLEITSGGGVVTRLLQGAFNVTAGVTR